MKRSTRKLLGVINMFIVLIVVMVSWAYIYIKIHHIVHLKFVQFIEWQLYINEAVKIFHF